MNRLLKATILTLLISTSLNAMDIGEMKASADNFLVETFYNDYSRDLIQETWDGEKFKGKQEEKRVIFRGTLFLNSNIAVSAQAGTTNAEHGSGSGTIFGFGGQWSFYEKGNFNLTVFAKANYIRGIEYNAHFIDLIPVETGIARVHLEEERKEKYWEYALGIQASYLFNISNNISLNLYGGLTASEVDSDCKEVFKFYVDMPDGLSSPVANESESFDNVDFEEDEPISAFLGLSTTIKEYNAGIRFEAQFIGQESYSIGLFKRL